MTHYMYFGSIHFIRNVFAIGIYQYNTCYEYIATQVFVYDLGPVSIHPLPGNFQRLEWDTIFSANVLVLDDD